MLPAVAIFAVSSTLLKLLLLLMVLNDNSSPVICTLPWSKECIPLALTCHASAAAPAAAPAVATSHLVLLVLLPASPAMLLVSGRCCCT
jgi:hypothetical protein